MPKQSAGILLYRRKDQQLELLVVHPGGPFWKNKNEGAWSIPKGEPEENEDLLSAAKREFFEETGSEITGDFIPLRSVKLKSGKTVYAFAIKGDLDATKIKSNLIEAEWPPRSGKKLQFPEVDKAEWFDPETAKQMINAGQVPLINELVELLNKV